MCPRLEVPEPGIGLGPRPPLRRARDEGGGGAVVPGLRAGCRGRAERDPQGDTRSPTHDGAIYAAPPPRRDVAFRRLLAAAGALALLLAACEDLNLPGGGVATADLLILPLQSGTPAPGGLSFYVYNQSTTTRSLIHSDGFNTVFASITFPSGSLASLDGVALGAGDSVLVTLSPDPGTYGMHLAPDGLRFASLGRPALTFSYARYGDFSVAAGSRYPDPAAYAEALGLWRESSLDAWASLTSTGNAGTSVTASLSQGGHYLVAALR